MSASWASRVLAALAAAAVLASPSAAREKPVAGIVVDTKDGNRRISIDRHGITLTRERPDSDSARARVTIDGDDHSLPIEVHESGSGIVRLFSDAHVPPGERIDGDVVAVFGSVRVDGEVGGAAVAVFGSLDLRPGSVVHGDAVAVGGPLRQSEGSKVSGDSVEVGFLPLTLGLPGLPLILATITLAWLVSLFFGWVVAALFPARLARVAATASRRTGASLALGVASGPLMIMSLLVLLVTFVGIPLAIVLPFVYVAVLYVGQLAGTYVLGCKLTRRSIGSGGVTAPLVAGTLLVASFFGFGAILWDTPGMVRTAALFFMLVGALLMLGLSTIGAGAFLLSRAGTRPVHIDGPAPGSARGPSPAADPVANV